MISVLVFNISRIVRITTYRAVEVTSIKCVIVLRNQSRFKKFNAVKDFNTSIKNYFTAAYCLLL